MRSLLRLNYPIFCGVFFAEGAFSQAFVPILAEYKSKQGEEATRLFVSYVSGLLTLALALVTVAGMVAAPGSSW